MLCLDWAAKTWYAVGAHYAACCGKAAALEKLKTQRAEVQQLVRPDMLWHACLCIAGRNSVRALHR